MFVGSLHKLVESYFQKISLYIFYALNITVTIPKWTYLVQFTSNILWLFE